MSLKREKNRRILLICDRERTYRDRNMKAQDKKGTKSTGSKKCGCPFLLKGKELSNIAGWVLMVVCGIHNHFLAKNLKGYSFAGRLSKEEENSVVDLLKTLVRPRDILNTLKQINNLNVSTLRTIYNARHKFKVMEYVERSQM